MAIELLAVKALKSQDSTYENMQPQYGRVSAGKVVGCNVVKRILPDSMDDGKMLSISVVGLCVLDPTVTKAMGSVEEAEVSSVSGRAVIPN